MFPLGWNIYEVGQRSKFLKYFVAHRGTVTPFDKEEPEPPWRVSKLPWAWRLLGAEPIRKIELMVPYISEFDARIIATWFPESEIELCGGNGTEVRIIQ